MTILTMKEWHGILIIKISDVEKYLPGFSKWLYGQTLPMVVESETPLDWAYYEDYRRFLLKKPIID